jgi:hypothetical protein
LKFNQKLILFFDEMGAKGVSGSSTIPLFAEYVGDTYLSNPIDTANAHRVEANEE